MVGGAILYREVIQREISRVLVLNLSGKKSGASALHRRSLPLTEPSLLSKGTLKSSADGDCLGHPPRRCNYRLHRRVLSRHLKLDNDSLRL